MKKYKGIKRIYKAFGYSLQGLKTSFKLEASFRQELLLAVILIAATFFVTNDKIEQVLLILPIFLILIVEIINSAIETVVDKFGKEKNKLSKNAKDMGSAAVFISFILLIIVWLIILI